MYKNQRVFDWDSQEEFARISGDRNPIHMNRVAARRTQMGAPIVHGIHSLIWLLECISRSGLLVSRPAAIGAQFLRPIYVGDCVSLKITEATSSVVRANLDVGAEKVMMASIGFREQIDAAPRGIVSGPPILTPEAPQALTLAQVEGVQGSLSLETITSQVDSLAPYASKVFGRRKIAALVCSSCVVGMVVPGLYSIFSGLRLSLDAGDRDVHNRMQFAVLSVARQLRSVRIGICGAGFRGSLETIYREQPVEQPKIERITALISREEFRNSTALIIGGSRGLGELTAKLIAAGGGHVAITYAAGKNDADTVVAELKNAGLSCEARFYDVHRPAEEQVAALGMVPTHVYYFATPMICRRKSGLLDQERFSELTHFYLAAFVEVVQACGRLNPKGLRVFYPSSNYVDMRPANMTEYAMAKAAGEVLCADLSRFIPGVKVLTRRLPQMLTDQTSSVLKLQSSDSIGVMLPIVREMHAGF